MRVMVDRADIDLKYRYNQLFPFLDVFAAYGRRGASAVQTNNATGLPPIPPLLEDASLSAAWEQIEDADAPSHTVGVLLSTPLSRVRERSSYKASKQLKQQAELVVKQREEWILREVSDAIANARSAKERAAATRQYRDYTKSALEAEVQKLSGGKSSLFFVYQLQTDLANAEAAEVRARADYNKAVSQLSFAEGSILERNQIAVESK
jgi:outer membrane protein TolC